MSDKEHVFNEYAHYYDLLYRDKDYQSEANYIAGLIQRFHPAAKAILELGSGTGKHASLLAKLGYSIHGVERSEEMLAQARKLAVNIPSLAFTQGDIRKIDIKNTFDVVMALFHVVSYQTANEDVEATFSTARKHLKAGGIFIFDVWYGPAVLNEKPAVRIKRMGDDKIEITRLAEPEHIQNENRVDVNYHVFIRDRQTGAVGELKETHAMRYFFKPEIEYFTNQAGFKIIHSEAWLSGHAISENTWGACFFLQAV